ncbi:MAG: NAD(P)-binding protein [Myxococcota bacterium]|jgi:cation diffusion facilitator CzcD-associated flavoprotein CzcO|nr:NAD(P)-binding protein [Myxococcota bacterium]
MSQPTKTRFTIIGAGAGGLCAGIQLFEGGENDFLIFDREPRVGGTWQGNTSDYYRNASGHNVTQWPHGFAVYQERAAKDDLSSFETGPV